MKPIEFRGMTGVLPVSKTRKSPLPVHLVGDHYNQVVTCWELSDSELIELIETNRIWIRQLKLSNPNLQPILPQVRKPIFQTLETV